MADTWSTGRQSLNHVLGSWVDSNGSNYKVELDTAGTSCSVLTVRPSGERKQTHALIRLADSTAGRVSCVHWGGKFALDLRNVYHSQICWKRADNGKDFFWWRSKEADMTSDVARPPRHNQGLPSRQATTTTTSNYEDALEAWGVPSHIIEREAAFAGARQRTPWPSWKEVEHLLPNNEISWPRAFRDDSTDEARSKLLSFLLARTDLLPNRRDMLRQCVGGTFSGHLIHAEDVDWAIAAAEERLSVMRDVASVTTSPGAIGGDLSVEGSETEATFDPLGRGVANCHDDEFDISSIDKDIGETGS